MPLTHGIKFSLPDPKKKSSGKKEGNKTGSQKEIRAET
jgi:hypothetical protein